MLYWTVADEGNSTFPTVMVGNRFPFADSMAQTPVQLTGKDSLDPSPISNVDQRLYMLFRPRNFYPNDVVHPNKASSHIAAETIASEIETHKEIQP